MPHERPREADPLTFPAREARRWGIEALAQAELDQEPPGLRLQVAPVPEGQPCGHQVLQRGQPGEQVRVLEDQADMAGTELGEVAFRRPVDPRAEHADRAVGRPIEPGDKVQERGLPQPDGPVMATVSPRAMRRSICASAGTRLPPLVYVRDTPSSAIAGSRSGKLSGALIRRPHARSGDDLIEMGTQALQPAELAFHQPDLRVAGLLAEFARIPRSRGAQSVEGRGALVDHGAEQRRHSVPNHEARDREPNHQLIG